MLPNIVSMKVEYTVSKKKRIRSNVSIDSPIAPPVHKASTHPTTSSQASSGRSSSQSTGVYVLSATTLKTKMKTAARKERNTNFLKLLRMALKMLVSYEIYVKISKR